MLDQLVESKSNSQENNRRSGFLLTTFVIMVTILMSAWLYSLFAKDFGMGGSDIELSTLVAPVPVPEEEPPPEPEKQPEKQKDPNVDVRKELIQNMDMTPVKPPDTTSVQKANVKAMRDYATRLGDVDSDARNPLPSDYRGPVNTSGSGSDVPGGTGGTGDTPTAPPPPPKKAPPKTISGGVLNGKATSLPKPAYPPAARAVRASGAVAVQVLIDENGRVVSASATSGHPLLRNAAVSAARGARFSPTMLSGQPVKVTGIITYNFVP